MSNVTNRMHGSYQAVVVSIEEPNGLYLAQVRLLKVWDAIQDSDLPWAEFLLPLGAGESSGHAIPVDVGHYVWVDFPRNGDTRFPRITGSLYYAPEYHSYLPSDINGEPYEPVRAEGEPEPPAYTIKDDLYQRNGLREHKTANGGWSITHVASGSAVEITEDGQIVIHTESNLYESATGNKTSQYGGNLNVSVSGDCSVSVGGGCSVSASGDCAVSAGGAASMEAGGDLTLKAGGNVNLESGGNFAVVAKAAPWTLG